MFNAIYPPLRTAKAEALKIRKKLTPAEIKVYGAGITSGTEAPDRLTYDELLYAADLTPDFTEKEKIYTVAIKSYDSYDAYNNLGAAYMSMAKAEKDPMMVDPLIDKAVAQFKLSLNKSDNMGARANLANAYLIQNQDYKVAEAELAKVQTSAANSVGQSVNASRGYILIQQGEYEKAIEALSAAGADPVVRYNLGLAYLLHASKMKTGDVSKAKSVLMPLVSQNLTNGYASYAMAIVGARSNDANIMYQYLAQAADRNEELAQRAVTDLEFYDYWTSDDFLNALK
jgi:tetratricopeptide (TPR) repeat protein